MTASRLIDRLANAIACQEGWFDPIVDGKENRPQHDRTATGPESMTLDSVIRSLISYRDDCRVSGDTPVRFAVALEVTYDIDFIVSVGDALVIGSENLDPDETYFITPQGVDSTIIPDPELAATLAAQIDRLKKDQPL